MEPGKNQPDRFGNDFNWLGQGAGKRHTAALVAWIRGEGPPPWRARGESLEGEDEPNWVFQQWVE